jgi:hypothetical protein
MTKKLCFLALCSALPLAVGCGDDDVRGGGDAGPTIVLDSGPGTDSGPATDGGPADTGSTTGECGTGVGCTPDRGCRIGTCMAENNYAIGGPMDPITGYPPGEDTPIPGVVWRGGYCTTSEVNFVDAPGACDPFDDESCGGLDCAQCLNVGQQDGRDLSVCLRTCTASLTENPCPGMGNTCLLGTNVCFPGCNSDDECRVQRRDTNDNGEIDPYDPAMNPTGDRLVYDDSTNAVCNMTTWRCTHDGVTGAEAGIACSNDFECEMNGDCITADGWTDSDGVSGYCTKFGCNTPGNDCAGSGVCQERRIGVDICLSACTVASEADIDGTPGPDTDWAMNAGVLGTGGGNPDCRGGYTCVWNGVDGAGVAGNGACVPGDYNDVTASNVGAACADSDECYSPFGAGLCLSGGVWSPSNYCSILDCGAPGMPEDVCGPSTQCVTLFEDTTACLANCTDATECNPGHACVEFDGDMATPKICFPICLADEDCRTGETCNIAPGDMTGVCE